MKIVYMHHAERERNTHAAWGTPERTFDEITDLGRRQAELLAERLRNEKITAHHISLYEVQAYGGNHQPLSSSGYRGR